MKTKFSSYLLVTLQFVFVMELWLYNATFYAHIIPLFVFCLGLGFGIYTLKDNFVNNFNIIPEIKENALLITTGAYKHIRHPMYFSLLCMMAGVLITSINFTTMGLYGLLIVTLISKAKKEEKLWSQHSPEYQAYMRRTKSIIPFVF
ncbi:MAG: isoprenylcysteine carboxylmethyltransferase family protein [Sulfurospirillaceae bacterium]|nr:isoprenylcysteine carboxylmethyltransferase family protein [Sulfurospirillaceae bacterium]MDD2827857.1 isoprenylcysteine carboxylmethyltransferase family protein [Sulfurospirillaceae bacterium]